MDWVGFSIIISVIIFFIVRHLISLAKKRKKMISEARAWDEIQKKEKEKRMAAREEYERTLINLGARLGECTMNVNLDESSDYKIITRVLVYEEAGILIVYGNEYRFSEILDYSLVKETRSETSTTSYGTEEADNDNLIGRAFVGGLLGGKIGALAGAATARRNISDTATSETVTINKYTLYININSLQDPTISLYIGEDGSKAHRLAGVLNVIIERNKTRTQADDKISRSTD